MPPQCLPLALALALTSRKITTTSWVVGGGGGGGGGGVGSVSGVPFDVCIGKGVEGWVGEEGEGLGGKREIKIKGEEKIKEKVVGRQSEDERAQHKYHQSLAKEVKRACTL